MGIFDIQTNKKSMLVTLINLVLSPFCLLFFVFYASSNSSRYFTPSGTNVYKLKPIPYLIYTAIYLVVILGLSYLWTILSDSNESMWEIFTPRYYWVSIPVWVITGFTIRAYLNGMEGNIMGFIYFPFLALSSIVLIGVNFMGLFSASWDFNLPILDYNFGVLFAVHAFSPMYVLLIVNRTDTYSDKPNDWISAIITTIILQLMLFVPNWGIVKVLGGELSFYQFFGEGQDVVYYMPMVVGLLYFVLFFVSQREDLKENKIVSNATRIVALLAIAFSLLQVVNYVRFIMRTFPNS